MYLQRKTICLKIQGKECPNKGHDFYRHMIYNTIKTSPVLKFSMDMIYSFVPCDNRAKAYITALTRAMNLAENGDRGRKVLVYVSEKNGTSCIIHPKNNHDPIICSMLHDYKQNMFFLQVQKIAQAVATDVVRNGGALIHGGLCSYKGTGAVMAGPGNVGKTTASNRLPAPWISYSDDATLIIPDGTGGFNAHPWPTWSRFYQDGPGGVWDVKKSIPLEFLFFLKQSETDYVEPLSKDQAKAMLIDTMEHLSRLLRFEDKEKHEYIEKCIRSAEKITSAIPAYRLGLSLEGEFWREMEKVMPKAKKFEKPGYTEKQLPIEFNRGKVHFIYRGPSMNPTFYEPEMLTIKPYNGNKPKKGDVICYRVDHKDESIVHRVVKVEESGIKTKGDNNTYIDDYMVAGQSVIGRVVASKRGNKTRTIHGGFFGVLEMYWCRGCRKIRNFISKFLHDSYNYLAVSGIFRKLKPKKMVFRLAVFEKYPLVYPKLVLNGCTVGTFDFRQKSWKINRPYRLFVDEKKLPVFERPDDI